MAGWSGLVWCVLPASSIVALSFSLSDLSVSPQSLLLSLGHFSLHGDMFPQNSNFSVFLQQTKLVISEATPASAHLRNVLLQLLVLLQQLLQLGLLLQLLLLVFILPLPGVVARVLDDEDNLWRVWLHQIRSDQTTTFLTFGTKTRAMER